MKQLFQKIKAFFTKSVAPVKWELLTGEELVKHKEDLMKAKADQIISDIHEFEHKEKMRFAALLHNGILLAFVFLTVLLVSKWFVFALLLWDAATYHSQNKNKS